jgi:hypothetical protein
MHVDQLLEGCYEACVITADLTSLRRDAREVRGDHGKYWRIDFSVVLLFGRVEFAAQLSWRDKHVGYRTLICLDEMRY